MSKRDLIILLLAISFVIGGVPAHSQNYELKTVVIDAGHGGKDPGAVANSVREKDVVLAVALDAGAQIKAAYPNVNVIYTRDKDVFIPLDQRADIANKNKADLFISIHANICGTTSVKGSETFVLGLHKTQENLEVAKKENAVILLEEDYDNRYTGFDPKESESYIMFELVQSQYLEHSTMLADRLQTEFRTTAQRSNRGVKQAGFLVLWKTSMPSVLVELGFLSNANEAKYLKSAAGQKALASSIANAFSSYKMKMEGKNEAATVTTSTTQQPAATTTSIPDKEPEITPTTKDEEAQIIEVSSLKGIWFAVQIMSLDQIEKENSPRFKNQKLIYHLKENGLHKYFLAASQEKQMVSQQSYQIKKDFNGAFPVAFIDGKKVGFNSDAVK